LWRNDLTAILITLKNRPHFGARAEISKKPRRKSLWPKDLGRNEKVGLVFWLCEKMGRIGIKG
jgi:hypothetical protein